MKIRSTLLVAITFLSFKNVSCFSMSDCLEARRYDEVSSFRVKTKILANCYREEEEYEKVMDEFDRFRRFEKRYRVMKRRALGYNYGTPTSKNLEKIEKEYLAQKFAEMLALDLY